MSGIKRVSFAWVDLSPLFVFSFSRMEKEQTLIKVLYQMEKKEKPKKVYWRGQCESLWLLHPKSWQRERERGVLYGSWNNCHSKAPYFNAATNFLSWKKKYIYEKWNQCSESAKDGEPLKEGKRKISHSPPLTQLNLKEGIQWLNKRPFLLLFN